MKKKNFYLKSIPRKLISLYKPEDSNIYYLLLLFLFITLSGHSQTIPSNIKAKAYERHNEITWDVLASNNLIIDVYRSASEGTISFTKIGQTTAAVYIDYVGAESTHTGWKYKLKSRTRSGAVSAFSTEVHVDNILEMTDNQFLDMVQESTFRYFWNFAHPVSGLTYESNTSTTSHTISIGGTGFGIMAIPVGIKREFITRQQGIDRLLKIVNFLQSNTTRFHGAWPHWINGRSGEVIPFSATDDGADLVETSFLIQGLLTAKEYFDRNSTQEIEIRTKIQALWEGVEWDWFRKDNDPYLRWGWSPNHGWTDLAIQGWSESMIAYILAISSPTHPIPSSMYDTGWARNGGFVSGEIYDNITLPLGNGNTNGGPLFLTHYSYLGLDPTKIGDKYIDSYYEQGIKQTLINRAYCIDNPGHYVGYDSSTWGLTASQSPHPIEYKAHEPTVKGDNGTIAPTAAISSIPYTPQESMEALKNFYRNHGENIWGVMGFYDAFNTSMNWTSNSYLAIDQGPIILMIENHRSKLLWENFMKNTDIQNGIRSIQSILPFEYDYSTVTNNTVKIFINNEVKLKYNTDSMQHTTYPLSQIQAVVGDEIMIEVHNIKNIPLIEGLPDLWVARAFINEGIFMSSKSITPGAYKPWVPFSTVSHSTLVLPYNRQWLTGKYQPNRYPEWKRVGDKYRLRWTLQRTMDSDLEFDNRHINYNDKYADEEVPWWQTWDDNGNPIVDGTGKFNKDGSVPYGEHAKPDGSFPQRQGKNTGMDMLTLNALKQTVKTAYGDNTNLSDGNPYYAKSDNDDTYTTEFKDLSTKPFNVTTPTAELYRPFTELWKVVPDGEQNNPVSAIVTWYQKAIHEYTGTPLSEDYTEDYTYNGYEIWEDSVKNPTSYAPGLVRVFSGGKTLSFTLDVQSPLEDDKFYTLYKANDNDNQRDLIVSTNKLEIGMDKNIKTELIDQMRINDSKFDLVLGYSTWDPKYTVHPLTLNDDGVLSGNKTFDLSEIGPGPALHAFVSYRRTPESKPVIITGTDFWLSFNIEAMRNEEYRNQSESRSLRKSDFAINALNNENHIDVAKHLTHGYSLSRINEEYTIMKGEQLTFKIWDNVDFAFKQLDTKWYMSSRKRHQQLSESDAAKRVKITLTKVANNGSILETNVLQDFNTGSSLTHRHTFNSPGNYIYEASLERDNSGYPVFVRVLNPEYYGTSEEGRVKVRKLLPREVRYLNDALPENQKITGDDYKLAMVTDLKASYAWLTPANGGGARSYMNADNAVKYIDRFAPFNDYADHYVYQLNDTSKTKMSTQNISAIQNYITTRDPQYKLLPGIWANHLDPLGDSPTKYGVEDEFNLSARIKNIDASFIESAFTQVQNTYADLYMVTHDGQMINSRSPRAWEIRLPWSSYSKYHGFRLRTAPKSPINSAKLKEAILKIGREGGGYFKTFGIGGSGFGFGGSGGSGSLGFGGSGNFGSGGSNLINPLLNPKSGFMDTDDQRLEYAFFLNLKHNRWVVIPNNVQNVIFYHGDDQDNQIASEFDVDSPALSGLTPIRLDQGDFYLINNENKCFTSTGSGSYDFQWTIYSTEQENGEENMKRCTPFTVSKETGPQNGILQYERIIQFRNQNKYIDLDTANAIQIVDSESKIIPYLIDQPLVADNLKSITFGNVSSTAYTASAYKLIPYHTVSSDATSHQDQPPATSSSHGAMIGGVTGGVLAGAATISIGSYLIYRNFSSIKNYTRLSQDESSASYSRESEEVSIEKKCN